MKSLTDFNNQMITVGPRLSHQFNMTVQTGLDKIQSILGEDLTIWADGTKLPGRTQNTADIDYIGYKFKVPSNFTMTQEMSLNVRCDKNMLIRDALLAWLAYFSDPAIGSGSFGAGVKRIPTSMIQLDLYNDAMTTIQHTYNLRGVIPTKVGDISMTHKNADIATFEFGCTYQYWDSVTINTPTFS